jgi:predicted enzyme related to lactoylglutathione lyase
MKAITVTWFEIPCNDIKRAAAFYEKVLKTKLKVQDFGGPLMAFFPEVKGNIGANGSLMQYDSYVPSHDGALVYFNCEDCAIELARVKAAGGKVLREKTMISPEHGFMGVIEDTEGNRVAMHSRV